MSEPYDQGPPGGGDEGAETGADRAPRIPPPRFAADDAAPPPSVPPQASPRDRPPEERPEPREPAAEGRGGARYDHRVLTSLLGAWALSACSPEEESALEAHLSECGACAEEALRLRDAAGLLHPEESLDLDPALRSRVLEGCLVRRPARVPVPEWAAPYDAETARLDALLCDMADEEWLTPVWLRWFDGERPAQRETTVGGVIAHLRAVDGIVAGALGLSDPLEALSGPGASAGPEKPGARAPGARTERLWRTEGETLHAPGTRVPWRRQGRDMVRAVSFAGPEITGAGGVSADYGDFRLSLADAFLDRAFECWVHAEDIADAVDYPYAMPEGPHLHRMVDLAARLLPGSIARRRRAGLAPPPRRLAAAGAPGRALHLEVEGLGGGDWYIPLDSPAASASAEDAVAHVALDGYEFCQLAAGHVPPQDAAAGQDGDREAVRDVLFAAASLSRL